MKAKQPYSHGKLHPQTFVGSGDSFDVLSVLSKRFFYGCIWQTMAFGYFSYSDNLFDLNGGLCDIA